MLYPVMAFGSSILVGKVVITTFPWVSSSLIFLLYLYAYESLCFCVLLFLVFELKDHSDVHKKFKLNRPESRLLYTLENFAC